MGSSPAAESAGGCAPPASAKPGELGWSEHAGGLCGLGHAGQDFAFDNEGPRHRVLLEPYRIADRLVTCGDWLNFMEDGGYADPRWWLSDGWAVVQAQGWRAPEYWREEPGGWSLFTLMGRRAVDPAEPVCHVSFYEADAFAVGRKIRVTKVPFSSTPKALINNDWRGFVKIISDPATGVVLGGSIVGRHAAELISVVALAATAGLHVSHLHESLFVHPSMAEALADAAE